MDQESVDQCKVDKVIEGLSFHKLETPGNPLTGGPLESDMFKSPYKDLSDIDRANSAGLAAEYRSAIREAVEKRMTP